MKSLSSKCAFYAAGILVVAILSPASEPVPIPIPVPPPVSLPVSAVTPPVSPTNVTELAELKAKEVAIVAEQRALEQKIFKVFRTLHVAREDKLKGDQELVELSREIARKQAELEKRTAEKYPEIGKQAAERDAMTKEHSRLAEQLRDVRKKMDVNQGLLPADNGPVNPGVK